MTDLAARAAALVGGRLVDASRVAGGNLSEVVRLRLADGRALIAKGFPPNNRGGRVEAAMLAAIAATGAPAPAVVGVADDLLVMEAVAAEGRLGGGAWTSLAAVLLRLHVAGDMPYGWPVDHAFGAVAILNERTESWVDFWAERRLACHLPHVDADIGRRLEFLAARLGDCLPAHPPSALLHGDLWGGNVLVCGGRVTALIDPACYYGDREVDVAMLTLFDHPPSNFLDALGLAPGCRSTGCGRFSCICASSAPATGARCATRSRASAYDGPQTQPASSRRTMSSMTVMPRSESLRHGSAANCSPPFSIK